MMKEYEQLGTNVANVLADSHILQVLWNELK